MERTRQPRSTKGTPAQCALRQLETLEGTLLSTTTAADETANHETHLLASGNSVNSFPGTSGMPGLFSSTLEHGAAKTTLSEAATISNSRDKTNRDAKGSSVLRQNVADDMCALRSSLEVVLAYETERDLQQARATRQINDMVGFE